MTGNISKRKLRIENKKKKMAALLDIAKLNEYDRTQKNRKTFKVQETTDTKPEAEPSPKRLKTTNAESDNFEEDIVIEDSPPYIGELGPSGKLKLQDEDYLKLKSMLRDTTKKRRSQPQFRLRDLGEGASLKVDINDRVPMFLSDLQHLIMYSQVGAHSPYSPARWCALEKHNKLVNTNLLIVENVSLYNFQANESQFPFLSSTFKHKLEMITPTSYRSDIVRELSMVPLTGTQMRKFQTSFGTLESAVLQSNEIFDTVNNFFQIDEEADDVPKDGSLPPCDKFSRTQLLLSGWQMVEENFPLPIQGLWERKYSGYRLTKEKYKHVTPFSPMFALDCEMCRTSTGDLELTRISVVDEKQKVFYDTLVKPDNVIIDYLTKWSGINKKMMRNVTTKLKEVQEDLRRLLPEDAILVGQSLGNDLHALKMMHPYIIDTSVIYNITGDRVRKTKLQVLAREFLMEKIQTSEHGHCSTEDSLACMKLVQLKLKKYLYYGDAVMNNVSNDIRPNLGMGTVHYATSMLRQCVKVDRTVRVVGKSDVIQKYKFYVDKGESTDIKRVTFGVGKSNRDVMEKHVETLNGFSVNIAHVRVDDGELEDDACKVYRLLDKWIQEVFDATSLPGLVMVLFGGQKQANGGCFLQLKKEKF